MPTSGSGIPVKILIPLRVMTIILLFIIGVFAGILAGLLGVGGGIIFTPVLFYMFMQGGLSQVPQWAIATSLFCTFIASISSVIKQYRNANFFLTEYLKVGICGVIGTTLGALITLSDWYGAEQFTILFTLLILYTIWSLLTRNRAGAIPSGTERKTGEITFLSALIIGLCGGMIASLAGVGGGIVMVPLMTLVFGLPFVQAVSISSGAIVIISLSAWLQMAWASPADPSLTTLALGFVDFGTAMPLIAGSLLGGYFGVKIGHRLSTVVLERIFVILLFAVAIRLIYDAYF